MSYKHILVALDLSDESNLLIDRAVSLAKPLGSEVSFVHIDVNFAELYTGLIDLNMAENQNHVMEASLTQLKKFAEYADYPIKHSLVGSGDLSNELRDTIKEFDVDLVVCGHHQDFWSKLLSSTRQLINTVPVDLLVVPIKE
ncbi:universal stress protein [Vibrio hippocampi]|uniref:Universal stress protein n=1 Tax=Vibrio hippocampi TaxID=654686 RepID=A0ABM8ZEH5_9VIBR|nr:universal stress protein [Vibrio hippocampi]CAH0524332.1 Universal stress protein A [Vibrio hippocampi]